MEDKIEDKKLRSDTNTGNETKYKYDYKELRRVPAQWIYYQVMGAPPQEHMPCPVCGSRDNMSINFRKNKFHCFGNHGAEATQLNMDIIDFVATVHNIPSWQAAKEVAQIYNTALNEGTAPELWQPCEEDNINNTSVQVIQPHHTTYTGKYDEEVNEYILQCLREECRGDYGLNAYLDERGITADVRRIHDIYTINPDDSWRIIANLQKVFPMERLKGLDIIGISQQGKPYFKLYSHPIIITYRDNKGAVTGFKGRAMPNSKTEKEKGKYKNISPQNGFNTQTIKQGAEVMILEGELDAISATECGFNAVSFGSAFATPTPAMIDFFDTCKERNNKIIVCYDNDKTGTGQKNEKVLREYLQTNYPTISTQTNDDTPTILIYAAMFLPFLNSEEIKLVKDFNDIFLCLNGSVRTKEQQRQCIEVAEQNLFEGIHDITAIAERNNMYPFEIRKGYMDLMDNFGEWLTNAYGLQYTFTNDYSKMKITKI